MVAELSAQPTPEQTLLERLASFAELLEAEWYNGNFDEKAFERLNADLTGIVAEYRQLTLGLAAESAR